jgi:HAD superfamily hydrolase (TIGR01509 family)
LLRALILDFDGIIVDSEPVILKLTQQMASKEGWPITEEEYYRDYLAYDDRHIIEHLYMSHGKSVDARRISELVEWKARAYEKIIRDGLPVLPGAVEFIRNAHARYPLAIASGSMRSEIEHLLVKLQIREAFQVLAAADDCSRSKPNPEVYCKALAGLASLPEFRAHPLQSSECLAIEDAPGGIKAAHAAGLKCLALPHSRPHEDLHEADWVFSSFAEVNLEEIARQFR